MPVAMSPAPRATWARLRALLSSQPAYAAAVLSPCVAGAGDDVDGRAARVLQGMRVAFEDVEGLGRMKEAREAVDEAAGEGWTENADWGAVVKEVAFYGLCKEGEDPLHDWAAGRLVEGAGLETGDDAAGDDVVVDVDGEREGDKGKSGFALGAVREGVVEVDLAMLGSEAAAQVVEARKALRAWRTALTALLKLLAAQEGWAAPGAKARKADVGRVEKLTLAAARAEEGLGKARGRCDKVLEKTEERERKREEKLRKEEERGKKGEKKKERERVKEEKVRKKEELVRRKEVKVRKEEKMKRKQASFMSSFLKKKGDGFGKKKDVEEGGDGGSEEVEIVSGGDVVLVGESGEEKVVSVTGDVAKLAVGKSPYAEHGLPLLEDAAAAPVSRWLQYLVPFQSPATIDRALRSAGVVDAESDVVEVGAAPTASLAGLLAVARARRCAAERLLPPVLREHRRNRRELKHDRAPRFAKRRAVLRGMAGEGYGHAPYKLLQFDKEHRPPYVGTMRKRSRAVRPRRPFGRDAELEYDYDSADDWEEEEPGESLSDDEKDKELEDAELKTLGMFGSDSESDDDDFLDDGDSADEGDGEDGDVSGKERRVEEASRGDDEQDDDEEEEDEVEDEEDKNVGDAKVAPVDEVAVIDVNALPTAAGKRSRFVGGPARDERKSKRRKPTKFRAPRVVIAGPVWDCAVPHPGLDQYPALRFAPGSCIKQYDADSAEAAAELVEGEKVETVRKPRRKTGVQLDAAAMDDLARVLHSNLTRGRDAIVELFFDHLRSGGYQLPSKAEASRAIDVLACRGMKTPWQFKDAAILSRLNLGIPTLVADEKRATADIGRMLCATPTTPPIESRERGCETAIGKKSVGSSAQEATMRVLPDERADAVPAVAHLKDGGSACIDKRGLPTTVNTIL